MSSPLSFHNQHNSMDKRNILEKHLLSRCYDSESIIEQLLDTRYSHGGDQKPVIVFKKTFPEKEKQKSILHREISDKSQTITKSRKHNARLQLRNYIKQTTSNQKKLVHKIQKHNRECIAKSQQIPFPIEAMLKRYRIPRYEDFNNLSHLWQSYMGDLLFSNGTIPTMSVLLPKLSSADYTGCLLTVTQSRNTNMVGTRGIVVVDAQFSFILCVPRSELSKEWNESKESFTPSEMVGGFRMVPKKGTLFSFDVIVPKKISIEEGNENNAADSDDHDDECVGFTLIGSRFEFRAVDRAGKKFKSHTVDDIL
ncbi:hypothetical protein G9P44_003859 [Scheffersomyces stipitis]|nr:hypothetical protein G9P44_003859 [Scheffersomyces stipitis]